MTDRVAAVVRVSGPPNSSFLVGYPGISATLPRIEGKVEIRPQQGITAPVAISLVRICLQRRETIHPAAENVAKRHLGTPRRETTDVVGKELLLYRCASGREADKVVAMDLPFVLFIPFGRGGEETTRRIPPASLQLPSRTAETLYELVVTVQQGPSAQNKYAFPVPLQRYDTLSTFGMYNRPKTEVAASSDSIVTLLISLPKWSYGPMDPISVYVKLVPNLDMMSKARKVTIKNITLAIEEEITYNPEGDEPTKKVNRIQKHSHPVNTKLPEEGYVTNIGVIFPHKDLRDSNGIIRRGQAAFPNYEVTSFTTTSTLYKIEFFLNIKATMNAARDVVLRQPIVICPLDHQACKEEMDAIEQAAKDASSVDQANPMLPARNIVYENAQNALATLGFCLVGGQKKPLIE
ncbi:arrestin domain-containing protein [Nemania sp. FL0916]|nr:arrestin domain-containing protein [Nemania sp. FL0916]